MMIGHPFDKKVDAFIFREPRERTPRTSRTDGGRAWSGRGRLVRTDIGRAVR